MVLKLQLAGIFLESLHLSIDLLAVIPFWCLGNTEPAWELSPFSRRTNWGSAMTWNTKVTKGDSKSWRFTSPSWLLYFVNMLVKDKDVILRICIHLDWIFRANSAQHHLEWECEAHWPSAAGMFVSTLRPGFSLRVLRGALGIAWGKAHRIFWKRHCQIQEKVSSLVLSMVDKAIINCFYLEETEAFIFIYSKYRKSWVTVI